MRSSIPALLTACCISLFSRDLLALRAEERRLELINRLFDVSEDVAPPPTATSKWPPPSPGRRPVPLSLSWAHPPSPAAPPPLQLLRSRRHLAPRGSHHHHQAQLMRVGCVLGTCQVQNLSHRLYQLIGQSGREDSSPINPKSPHSYG